MIRPSAPRARGGRTARDVLLLAALAPTACGSASDRPTTMPPAAPGEPLPELAPGERGRFFVGRALFERLATADEGLGPLYNAKRCSDCHDQPVVGGGGTRFPVLKATRFADGRCDLLEAHGGDNIQRRATELARAHGIAPEDVPEDATATSSVVAPPLLGLGLLEAVPDSVLDGWADPDDADADGISGRAPRTPPGPDGGRPARFGRKGDAATIKGFVDAALRFELGFTTPDHPAEEPRNGIPVPPEADPVPDPEIDQATLDLLSDYVRLLAPPAPEVASTPQLADTLAQGAALFRQIGCASCHRPEVRTGPTAPYAALANRTVRPYSDLLLHDMGPSLADVCGRSATPQELRTAPLWGLRHRTRLLHDGRAQDAAQALAAHGGEATSAREAFAALSPEARSALLRFLGSL